MAVKTTWKSVVAALILSAVITGCGGGNKMFSNRGGFVESGELVLDSLPRAPEQEGYVIGYGDALDINFLYNKEFTRLDVKVRPDGKISYPYIGELEVAGITVSNLENILTDRFSEILRDPYISVMVRSFQSRHVYVFGEVNHPGAYSHRDKGSTLLMAISSSGGPKSDAKRNGVLVIRRMAPDHIVGIQIDLEELLEGHNFGLDIPLEPYDIVYVPRSAITKARDFANSMYDILSRPLDLYLRGWEVKEVKVLYDFYRKSAGTQIPK